jgi:hypothetical protein
LRNCFGIHAWKTGRVDEAELIPKPAMTGEGILSGISNFIQGDAETYRPGFKANTTLF